MVSILFEQNYYSSEGMPILHMNKYALHYLFGFELVAIRFGLRIGETSSLI